jgi:hypothetical protein
MLDSMRPVVLRFRDAFVRSRLLREENGIALIMALGMLTVLALVLASVIFLTASGARDAKRTNAGQKAYAIAEAGLNSALAQLAPHYPSFSPAGLSSWVTPTTGLAYPGGTVGWTGTFSGSDWTLTGTGTITNPAGGNAVVRTVSANLHVSQVPADFQPFGIFSGDPNAECTDIGGGVTVNVPIYVKNCLVLRGSSSAPADPNTKAWDPGPYTAGVSQHTVTVNVVNGLTLQNGMHIGYNSAPNDHRVKSVAAGSCASCDATTVFSVSPTTNTPDNSISLPTLDADSIYASVNWGGATCSTGTNPFDVSPYVRNNTGGNLFGSTYNCSLTDSLGKPHSISYNTGTHALAVNNSWYIDGDVSLPNATVVYTGKGTIYVNGTVTASPSANLCTTALCGSWDPTDPLQPNLLFVSLNAPISPTLPQATSFTVKGTFEANAWAVGNGAGDTSPIVPTALCSNGAFMENGGSQMSGSVWTQNGCAKLTGGGVLHSAVALPSGSPVSTQWALLSPISGYKGG